MQYRQIRKVDFNFPDLLLNTSGFFSQTHTCTFMNILLTNDDGIYAPGLWALHRRFSIGHTVTVVAPDRERSAVGHGITLHEPLRATHIRVNGEGRGYAVNGTPADCIKLSVLEILKIIPDMVISGINPGANVGINAHYSGTVAAAREAALLGLSSLAVSVNCHQPAFLDEVARFVEGLSRLIIERGLPRGVFLNVNIPNIPINTVRGISISSQGVSVSREGFEKRVDPRNRTYYWQELESPADFTGSDMDGNVLSHESISITPMRCDMTDYDVMADLKSWDIALPESDAPTVSRDQPSSES
jgi:5'-nucleotidase